MLSYGSAKSFVHGSKPKRQEKQTGAQATAEGAKRLSVFGGAMKDKKDGKSAVSRLQAFGQSEADKAKKKKVEPAKAVPKSTAPEKGFFARMYEKYSSKK